MWHGHPAHFLQDIGQTAGATNVYIGVAWLTVFWLIVRIRLIAAR
jgi:hypothetical protein